MVIVRLFPRRDDGPFKDNVWYPASPNPYDIRPTYVLTGQCLVSGHNHRHSEVLGSLNSPWISHCLCKLCPLFLRQADPHSSLEGQLSHLPYCTSLSFPHTVLCMFCYTAYSMLRWVLFASPNVFTLAFPSRWQKQQRTFPGRSRSSANIFWMNEWARPLQMGSKKGRKEIPWGIQN